MEPFCQKEPDSEAGKAFVSAVKNGDAEAVQQLLSSHPALRSQIDEPWFSFDSPAVVAAKNNPELVQVLIEQGANINQRSDWWAGSFGILDGISEELAEVYLAAGAELDIHAAVQLNRLDDVRSFITRQPESVNEPGGDGQRPLHFCRSVEMIDLLVDAGAELEARDLDHSATAVQTLVDRPAVCQHLVRRGAHYDVFAAAALGRIDWLETLFVNDPQVLEEVIGSSPTTRPIHPQADRHIYAWKLGSATTPLQVADRFQQEETYDWIYERSRELSQWLSALWKADPHRLAAFHGKSDSLLGQLDAEQKKTMARAAWEGNLACVQSCLDAGFHPHWTADEQSTPLDRAAFHGFHEIVRLLLEHDPDPPLEFRNGFGGTPLGACIYGATHSWKREAPNSNHVESIKLLIQAGAKIDPAWIPSGQQPIDDLLNQHIPRD